jgi:hypothetical protein
VRLAKKKSNFFKFKADSYKAGAAGLAKTITPVLSSQPLGEQAELKNFMKLELLIAPVPCDTNGFNFFC